MNEAESPRKPFINYIKRNTLNTSFGLIDNSIMRPLKYYLQVSFI